MGINDVRQAVAKGLGDVGAITDCQMSYVDGGKAQSIVVNYRFAGGNGKSELATARKLVSSKENLLAAARDFGEELRILIDRKERPSDE